MKQKDTMPLVIIIGRDDRTHSFFKLIFKEHGLNLYKVLHPQKNIDWSEVEPADVIITDLEDLGYGFKDCELLDTVRTLYPNKIVIAETETYNPEISAKVNELGANGYIYRDELENIMGAALVKIVNGERFFMGVPSYEQN